VTITGLLPGPNEVAVRSLNNLRQSVGDRDRDESATGTPTLTLARRRAGDLSATTLTLTGSINAPSQLVRLESSTDGANWADTGLSWTSTAAADARGARSRGFALCLLPSCVRRYPL